MSLTKLENIKRNLQPLIHYTNNIPYIASGTILVIALILGIYYLRKYRKQHKKVDKGDIACFLGLTLLCFSCTAMLLYCGSIGLPYKNENDTLPNELQSSINVSIQDKKQESKTKQRLNYLEAHHQQISKKPIIEQNQILNYQKLLKQQLHHQQKIINKAKRLEVNWSNYL